MKRFLCLLTLLAAAFALSSCSEPPTVQSDFSAVFTAHAENADYAGSLYREGTLLSITLSEPYTVAETRFEYRDAALSVTHGCMSTEAGADWLPYGSLPAALHTTLAYLSQAAYTGTQDGTDCYTLPTPYGEASLTACDGLPLTLTDPHSGFTVTFSGQQHPPER